MTPQEIQAIYNLLANRVVPQSATEGAAILALARKLLGESVDERLRESAHAPDPRVTTNGNGSHPS